MKEVSLIRVNNVMYVRPWIPELENELTCFRRTTLPPKPGSSRMNVTYNPEPLYYIHSHSSIPIGIVYGGLFTRVYRFLRQRGYKLNIENKLNKVPTAHLDAISDVTLRSGQEMALAAVLSSYRGIIKAPPGLGKTFIIELICKAYPDLKVMVVTSRSQVLTDIARRIKKRIDPGKVTVLAGGKAWEEDSRVIVVSAKSLHRIDPDWPDLVLFDEVHGAAAPKVSDCLSQISRARMFGFSASPSGRSDQADLLTEAIFGPIISNISYSEAEKNEVVCPIEVWMIPVQGVEVPRNRPVSRDRWNIWRNRTRNRIIQQTLSDIPEDKSVLVLVNTVEHAMVLKGFLPDYTLMYASLTEAQRTKFHKAGLCPADQPLSLDKEQIKSDFREGKLKRIISTQVFREGVDFPELRVVCRADGTKGPIPATQIGGRLSRIAEGKTKGVLIDFTDEFGSCYVNRSKNRRKNYIKEGWTIINGLGELE